MPFLRVAGQHHPSDYHHQYRRDPLSGELRYCRPGFPPDNPLEYRRGVGHSDELFCLSPSTPGFGTHLGNPDTIKYDIPTAIPGSWIARGAHAAATSAAAPPAQFWAKPPRKDEPGIPWVAEMKRGAWHAHHNARHILPQGGPASPWSPGLWRPGGVPWCQWHQGKEWRLGDVQDAYDWARARQYMLSGDVSITSRYGDCPRYFFTSSARERERTGLMANLVHFLMDPASTVRVLALHVFSRIAASKVVVRNRHREGNRPSASLTSLPEALVLAIFDESGVHMRAPTHTTHTHNTHTRAPFACLSASISASLTFLAASRACHKTHKMY